LDDAEEILSLYQSAREIQTSIGHYQNEPSCCLFEIDLDHAK